MAVLLYLMIAVVMSIVGVVIVYARRRKPQTLEGTIGEFSRGLQALAPDQPVRTKRPVRPRRPAEGDQVG